jgi:hypothetical protein
MEKHVGVAHPNIFKAVEVFKKEELNSYSTFKKAISGEKAPYRRKLDIDKQNHLTTHKDLLESNDISLEVYIKKLI